MISLSQEGIIAKTKGCICNIDSLILNFHSKSKNNTIQQTSNYYQNHSNNCGEIFIRDLLFNIY